MDLYTQLKHGWDGLTTAELIGKLAELYPHHGVTREQLQTAASEWDHRVYDRSNRKRRAELLLKAAEDKGSSPNQAEREASDQALSGAVRMMCEVWVEQRAEEQA